MGPKGNRPELFEPGARILYMEADRSRHVGEVEGQTGNYVVLVDGSKVRKDRVLGPSRKPEGWKTYRVVLNLHGLDRTPLHVHATDPGHAREQAERAARNATGLAWEAGTVTLADQQVA